MSEKTRQVKISISLPAEDAERFNAYCQQYSHTKSGLAARALREFLDREQFGTQPLLFDRRTGGRDQVK